MFEIKDPFVYIGPLDCLQGGVVQSAAKHTRKQWLSVLLKDKSVNYTMTRTHTLLIRNTRAWVECTWPLSSNWVLACSPNGLKTVAVHSKQFHLLFAGPVNLFILFYKTYTRKAQVQNEVLTYGKWLLHLQKYASFAWALFCCCP